MLTNIFGGLQGIVDHALVGHLVGYTGNAAIGVAWQIFIVIIVFINSLFTGMSVLVARFAGAGRREGRPHGLSGVSDGGRPLVPGDGAVGVPPLAVAARSGERGARSEGVGASVPPHHVPVQRRNAHFLRSVGAALGGRRADADGPRRRHDCVESYT